MNVLLKDEKTDSVGSKWSLCSCHIWEFPDGAHSYSSLFYLHCEEFTWSLLCLLLLFNCKSTVCMCIHRVLFLIMLSLLTNIFLFELTISVGNENENSWKFTAKKA